MTHFLKTFRDNEDGAVTVDWVVLTAAIVGLGVGVIATISSSALNKSTGLEAKLSSQQIMTH